MYSTIKSFAILMMLISANMISSQSLVKETLFADANKSSEKMFDVSLRNLDGKIFINWLLPISVIEGNYTTERSEDGINFKQIAIKHYDKIPSVNNNNSTVIYSYQDSPQAGATYYYRFSKLNNDFNSIETVALAISIPSSFNNNSNDFSIPAVTPTSMEDNSSNISFPIIIRP